MKPPLPASSFHHSIAFTAREGTWISLDVAPDGSELVYAATDLAASAEAGAIGPSR